MKRERLPLLITGVLLAFSCGGGGGGSGAQGAALADDVRVFAVNDLGMHCVDREFSVFSLLPPFNVVHAEVVRRRAAGPPVLVRAGAQKLRVTYQPVADARGSINSTSRNKTDFWNWAQLLFGVPLAPGQGLTGLYMPADAPVPAPQPVLYDGGKGFYSWVDERHGEFFERDEANCRACHGLNLEGSVLSRAAADRTFRVEGRNVAFPKGTRIGCAHCHDAPGGDD